MGSRGLAPTLQGKTLGGSMGPEVLIGASQVSMRAEAGAMGGTASIRWVTFKAKENENITMVRSSSFWKM